MICLCSKMYKFKDVLVSKVKARNVYKMDFLWIKENCSSIDYWFFYYGCCLKK